MKKTLFLSFILLLFVGLAVDSGAAMRGKGRSKDGGMDQMEMGRMGMCGEHRMMEIIKSLGLDEKQAAEIKAIHFSLKKEVIRKSADAEVKAVELKEIMGKDPVDIREAETKIREIEALKSDIKIAHIKAHEEIKAKLTPEQRKKFESMMEMYPMGCMECEMGMMGGGMMGKAGKPGMKKGMRHMMKDDE